jgi:hypothetical protein
MWVGPRGAAVIANVRALLRPSDDKFEELHRLAKLEMVLDPRCGDLDSLEFQGAYIKLLKQAVDAKEYTTGRKTEGHTFNNQGGCALGWWWDDIFGSLDGAAVVRAGRRREGATERAVG